jgi:hypothetical protein
MEWEWKLRKFMQRMEKGKHSLPTESEDMYFFFFKHVMKHNGEKQLH